jgi:NTP pyrophosphatase (non-canonical NTP hydrolase)
MSGLESLQVAIRKIDILEERNDELEEILARVKQWCEAYPIDLFIPPDWDEVKEKLGDKLLTRVSAANMRHITEGIVKVIDNE